MKMFDRMEVISMTVRQPRYTKEEFARRGDEIYQSQVRLPPVGSANASRRRKSRQILSRLPTVGYANDIETGAFELGDLPRIAVDRLYDRYPDDQPWVIRIGHRSAIGGCCFKM
jgi:hypothetical protein